MDARNQNVIIVHIAAKEGNVNPHQFMTEMQRIPDHIVQQYMARCTKINLNKSKYQDLSRTMRHNDVINIANFKLQFSTIFVL